MVSEHLDQVDRAAIDAMWANDRASRGLGMTLIDVGPGTALVSMEIRADLVNGHDIGHGGLVATLADTAFAVACNSRGRMTVAAGFTIDFLEPVRRGDLLLAEARELALRGRSGIYDVTVRRGEVAVAELRGRSRALAR